MMAPITVPTPPVTAAPPMNAAAIASSSKRVAVGRVRQVEPGGEDDAGERGQHAHVDEHPEVDLLGLDAGQLGRVQVAADGVDVPAEDRLVHHQR